MNSFVEIVLQFSSPYQLYDFSTRQPPDTRQSIITRYQHRNTSIPGPAEKHPKFPLLRRMNGGIDKAEKLDPNLTKQNIYKKCK